MAGPVTHILLALKLFQTGLLDEKNVDLKKFIIGVSFPDIRYMGKISREETHPKNITWQDVVNEKNAFYAGLLFHALTDEIREAFVIKTGIYNETEKSAHRGTCMKFVEDIELYEHSDQWEEIVKMFDTILPEELTFGVPESMVKEWHALLHVYCLERPDKNIFFTMIRKTGGLIFQTIRNLNKTIQNFEKNTKIRSNAQKFYNSFEELLIQSQ